MNFFYLSLLKQMHPLQFNFFVSQHFFLFDLFSTQKTQLFKRTIQYIKKKERHVLIMAASVQLPSNLQLGRVEPVPHEMRLVSYTPRPLSPC